MQHTVPSATAAIAMAIAMAAVSLLTGCGAGDDMTARIGLPASQINDTNSHAGDLASAVAVPRSGRNGELVVTGRQRGYLDALQAAGIKPSSELLALSIGSYVCQTRAAKQNDQAVWDFVLPLVRSDVRDSQSGDTAPLADEVNAATADYIRIATERLC